MARSRFLFSPFGSSAVPFAFFADRLVRDEDFRTDLKRLANLSQADFDLLAKALAAHPDFMSQSALADIIAKHVPVPDQKPLAATISRLNEMMRDSSDTVEEALVSLVKEVKEHKEFSQPESSVIEGRLRALIAAPPGLAKQKKADDLAEATASELNALSIICDVRPVFDEERKTIDGVVAVTTLRLDLQEIDGRIAVVECRLNDQQLEQLCKTADTTRRKLGAIKELLESKSIPLAKSQKALRGLP